MDRRTPSSSRDWAWWGPGIFLLCLAVGCAWPPWNPPNPQPTPTPEPTPWECQLDMPGCHEYDPPLQCSSTAKPCWHNPTQNPHHCEEAPRCEDPPPPELPEPQCMTFTDRGGVFRPRSGQCDCYFGQVWNPCEEPGTGCTFPQGVPESDFTSGETSTLLGTQVNAAMERVTKCPKGTDCATGMPADEFFDAVNEELRSTGLCAGRHKDSPPGASDEIAVAVECTGWWEGYHVYNYGGGKVVWSPGAGRPKWKIDPKWCAGGPPPSGECPAPHPDLTKMKFNSAEKGSHLDTTWITNYQPDFCGSIGYCCMPGTGTPPNTCGSPGCVPRGGCPVRGDGDPERDVCEAELCNQKWECNGEPYPPYRGNPAQTDCRGHWKTWCSAPGSTAVLEGDR